MASELELKLRCTKPLDWSELIAGLKDLGAITDQIGSTKQLENTYFDTPDLALNKARIALRLRTKAGKLIQTLKTAGHSTNGVHQRGEWEWVLGDLSDQIRTNDLDFQLLEGLPEWQKISSTFDAQALAPAFSTNFTRTEVVFCYKGLSLELVLDQGLIESGSGSGSELGTGPTTLHSNVTSNAQGLGADGYANRNQVDNIINEVEIELTSVDPVVTDKVSNGASNDPESIQEYVISAMAELADLLISALPLQPYDISKAQRGYALLKGEG